MGTVDVVPGTVDEMVVRVGTIEKGTVPENGTLPPELGRACTWTMLGFTSRWWALTGTPRGFGLLGTTTGLAPALAAEESCRVATLLGVEAGGDCCALTATLGTRCSGVVICGMAGGGREGWGSAAEIACILSPTVT